MFDSEIKNLTNDRTFEALVASISPESSLWSQGYRPGHYVKLIKIEGTAELLHNRRVVVYSDTDSHVESLTFGYTLITDVHLSEDGNLLHGHGAKKFGRR
ncbi:MAG: hypothetical protein HRT61_09855 [Ekhidna sp.]|nr:hypothetical protein [Ekhidna sp.]